MTTALSAFPLHVPAPVTATLRPPSALWTATRGGGPPPPIDDRSPDR